LDMGSWDGSSALCREMEIDGLSEAVAFFRKRIDAASIEIAVKAAAAIEVFEMPDGWMDLSIPLRRFLFENIFPFSAVSFISGAGGTSKSMLELILACSLCIGRELLPGFRPTALMRVGITSLEDDSIEHLRRLQWIAKQYRFTAQEASLIQDRLVLCTPSGSPSFFIMDRGGAVVPGEALRQIQAVVEEYELDVLFIDPLSGALSGLDENANATAQCCINVLRATFPEIAIVLLAHLAKADRQTAQGGTRGAGAWQDGCRQALVIRALNSGEIKACSIAKEDEDRFFTLLSTKQNYGRPFPQMFFERVDGGVPVAFDAGGRVEKAQAERQRAIEEAIAMALIEQEPNLPLRVLSGKNSPVEYRDKVYDFRSRVIELSKFELTTSDMYRALSGMLADGKIHTEMRNSRKVLVK
jgi:RecA-family ATPase